MTPKACLLKGFVDFSIDTSALSGAEDAVFTVLIVKPEALYYVGRPVRTGHGDGRVSRPCPKTTPPHSRHRQFQQRRTGIEAPTSSRKGDAMMVVADAYECM